MGDGFDLSIWMESQGQEAGGMAEIDLRMAAITRVCFGVVLIPGQCFGGYPDEGPLTRAAG
ncbi:hypothetical protein D3C86_2065230 [compost metagenome]